MQAANQSDEWLMGQVARGKRDCLEVLVRRHATPLLTYLARMCGDKHRAEELVQESFLAVWNKRKTYRLDKPLKAWLYAIATNRCRSAFRSASARPIASLDCDNGLSPRAGGASPVEAAVRVERAALVPAAVAELPPQQRMVVALRVWGGLSYAEIAESAGGNEATIRSHMHRALEALRRSLARCLGDD
jgi:RNA polymerase sigma-70 factor (ECF subfamily)